MLYVIAPTVAFLYISHGFDTVFVLYVIAPTIVFIYLFRGSDTAFVLYLIALSYNYTLAQNYL